MYDICIIGAGATGLSLLLLLQDRGISPSNIAMVDPHFDGGDLVRKWTSVISNTPWSKTFAALPARYVSTVTQDPSATAPLAELGSFLRRAAQPMLQGLGAQVQGWATRADWVSATRTWSVAVKGCAEPILARRLVLAPGGEPRALDLPIPSIPLEIALDRQRIRHYVSPGQRVLQFGTMHSGTLIARNLVEDCSAQVVACYNTPEPFVWDRDGAYDGLKAEAAEIADAIQRGAYASQLRLCSTNDTAGFLRASRIADWVVYAMGFKPRDTISLYSDGQQVSAHTYHGSTGALQEAPAAWGFGVAYPNRAPDGVHWDVSVAAFLEHMRGQLDSLLEG